MASSTASGRGVIVLDEDEDADAQGGDDGRGFEQDAVVRLMRLMGSSHLNGRLALVLRFVPEKLRYEVALHPGSEKKALKPQNMEPVSLLDEVTLLRDRLTSPKVEVTVARPALRRLEALRITTDVLRQTLVGKVVNEASRTLADFDDIAEMARRLVARWREMYRVEQAVERGKAEQSGSGRAGTAAGILAGAPATSAGLAAALPFSPQKAPVRPASAVGGGNTGGLASSLGSGAAARRGVTTGGRPSWSLAPPQPQAKRPRLATKQPDPAQAASEAPPEAPPDEDPPVERSRVDSRARSEAPPEPPPGERRVDPVARSRANGSQSPAPGQRPLVPATQQARATALAAAAGISNGRQAVAPPAAALQGSGHEEDAAAEVAWTAAPELSGLEPAYANMIMSNPKIKAFLVKHPSVMKNLNAESVKFLIRNVMRSVKNAKPKQGEAGSSAQDGDSATSGGRALTIRNLPAEATESDIEMLFARTGLGHVEVSLARESRHRRSTGIAFAIVDSREAAEEAVQELQGAVVHGFRIIVEFAGSGGASSGGSPPGESGEAGAGEGGSGRRLVWKDDDELWEVAFYERGESVEQFQGRIQEAGGGGNMDGAVQVQAAPAEASRTFKEAATRERAEESRRVREALSSEPS